MATQAARGFTIIEVVLFLAVTGLLAIGIFAGSSASIAQQRYRDSVNSLKGFIQEQYNQTTNVLDADEDNPACKKTGPSLELDPTVTQPRGTSECLRLGRYVLIESTTLTAYDVVGRPITNNEADNDIDSLKNYVVRVTNDVETEDVAWDGAIVEPKTTTGLTVSLLILRSPLSGTVMTFVRDGNHPPSDMINSGYMVEKDLCVSSLGGSVTSHRLAVRINAMATSQSSIEIPLEKDNACD